MSFNEEGTEYYEAAQQMMKVNALGFSIIWFLIVRYFITRQY